MEDIFRLSTDREINNTESKDISVMRSPKEIAEIYDRHINTVYRICFSIMENSHDAEDAVQSVFLKMMKANPVFSDTGHEKAWLIITAQNCCRDIHRQWWRKHVVRIDSLAETSSQGITYNYDTFKKLLRLPYKQRIVLYLHYYEGYKLTEIASILKLNENTVKSRIRSAKKHMKIELGDDF